MEDMSYADNRAVCESDSAPIVGVTIDRASGLTMTNIPLTRAMSSAVIF
jgi:hypothetical protein